MSVRKYGILVGLGIVLLATLLLFLISFPVRHEGLRADSVPPEWMLRYYKRRAIALDPRIAALLSEAQPVLPFPAWTHNSTLVELARSRRQPVTCPSCNRQLTESYIEANCTWNKCLFPGDGRVFANVEIVIGVLTSFNSIPHVRTLPSGKRKKVMESLHVRIRDAMETWAKGLSYDTRIAVVFVTDQWDPDLPFPLLMAYGCSTGHWRDLDLQENGLLCKDMTMYSFMATHYPNAQWFMRIADDAYILTENLDTFTKSATTVAASTMRPSLYACCCRNRQGVRFFGGASGWLFDRAVLNTWVENAEDAYGRYWNRHDDTGNTLMSDFYIGGSEVETSHVGFKQNKVVAVPRNQILPCTEENLVPLQHEWYCAPDPATPLRDLIALHVREDLEQLHHLYALMQEDKQFLDSLRLYWPNNTKINDGTHHFCTTAR